MMTAAREAGISFLDDARYDDHTGTAPIPTGYSEVVFGELFRASGWKRDEVVVANKLWWEHWPEQSAACELDGSLGRMRFDHVDLVYAERPPEGLSIGQLIEEVAGLIAAGKARVWGVLNWTPEEIAEVARVASSEAAPAPCAAQLPYSVADPEMVEDGPMTAALDAAGASVVASYVLAGGALTGKYAEEGMAGRLGGEREAPRRQRAFRAGERLRELAVELDTTPATLALAFALANARVASALFGATRPDQVADNVGALELLQQLDESGLARLRG